MRRPPGVTVLAPVPGLPREDGRPGPALLERLAAHAAGVGSLSSGVAEVAILRHRARGTVMGYRLSGGSAVIAKRYMRPAEAAAAYDHLSRLRDGGFAPPAPHRVPEPLACFAELGVLLMSPAEGDRLPTLAGSDGRWEDGLRAAGAWLARLHLLPADVGSRYDSTGASVRLARRAARACAQRPDAAPLVIRLLDELADRSALDGRVYRLVPTHGRYHPGHVFVAGPCATVIDIDRLATGDPAADLGEFLHRLRLLTRRVRLEDAAADRAARLFLASYAQSAGNIPAALVYFWSYSAVWMLLHLLEVGHPRLAQRIESYQSEFADIPRRVADIVASLPTEGQS